MQHEVSSFPDGVRSTRYDYEGLMNLFSFDELLQKLQWYIFELFADVVDVHQQEF